MKPEVKAFDTSVVLSLYTGCLLCNFSDMHAFAEFLCGTSVWTHQFAHRPFVNEMSAALKKQIPALADVDASAVTKENWQSFRDEMVQRFGTMLNVHPMGEPEHYADGFSEPLKLIGAGQTAEQA